VQLLLALAAAGRRLTLRNLVLVVREQKVLAAFTAAISLEKKKNLKDGNYCGTSLDTKTIDYKRQYQNVDRT
jgi:hypothetical protein